jgi:hypothetical protein
MKEEITNAKWKVIEEICLFFERRINITEVQDNVKEIFDNLEKELSSKQEEMKGGVEYDRE